MRKHDVSYHEYDDFISFKLDFCTHLEASEHSFSTQSKRQNDESSMLINEFKSREILKRTDNEKSSFSKRTFSLCSRNIDES